MLKALTGTERESAGGRRAGSGTFAFDLTT